MHNVRRATLLVFLVGCLSLTTRAEHAVVMVNKETTFTYQKSKKGILAPFMVHVRQLTRVRIGAAALPWPESNNYITYDSMDCRNLQVTVNAYNAKGEKTRIRRLVPFVPEDQQGFASDLRGFNYFVPNLEANAEIEEIVEYDDYSLNTSTVYLRNSWKVQNCKIEISYPDELKLAIHPFNFGPELAVVETHGSTHTYTVTNKTPLEEQPYETSGNDVLYRPWLLVRFTGYQSKEGIKPLFDTPQNLRDWYVNLYNKHYTPSWDSLPQPFVDSLYAGAKTPAEKLERANQWVQKNIKYVAFLEGDDGWVPHSAVRVYKQRFGDCKGMSSLLHCLVKKAGIKTTLALVGTRSIFLNPDSLPSPRCFNHMIALAYLDTTQAPIVLDGTNSLLMLGQLPESLQGKTALALHGPKLLVKFPVMDQTYSRMEDSVLLRIDGQTLVYQVRTHFYGYYKDINYLLGSAQTDAQRKEWMQKAILGDLTNATCKVIALEPNERNDKPFRIVYDLRVPNAVSTHGDKLYFNPWKPLMTTKAVFSPNIPEDHLAPFDYDYRSESNQNLSIELPKGYTLLTYHQPVIKQSSEHFDFSHQVAVNGNKLDAKMSFVQKSLYLMPGTFGAYRKSFSNVKQVAGTSFVLQATTPK